MGMQKRGRYCVLLCLTLGLTTAGIWTNVVGYSVNLFPADLASIPGSSNRDALLWGRLFVGITLVVFARFIPRIQTTLAVVVAVVLSAATGALILSYHQTLLNPGTLSSAAIFVARGGYTFLVSLFYILFAQRMQTSYTVICITLSLVAETVSSILISLYCSTAIQICVAMFSPILIIVFYFIAERLSRGFVSQDTPKELKRPATNVLLIQVVIFSILLALIKALSDTGVWGSTRTNLLGITVLSIEELVAISAIVVLLSYLVFILPQNRFPLQIRCIFAFVVLLAGLQVLALTNDYQFSYLFDVVTTAVELFAHLAQWMIIIVCIRKTEIPVFRIIGISRTFYALISLAWTHFIEKQAFTTSSFVMIIIYVLLVAILLLVFSGRIMEALFSRSSQADTFQEKLNSFSHKWRLSQRESQILELLLNGKQRSEIESECQLSEGTVKTHIANIYRKLDVHSKREMLDLFESDEHHEET
jgi:DNA-binding CsgD family transcriptional regulator